MFGVLKTIATVLLVASAAIAIDIQPLSNAQSGMPTTVRWTPVSSSLTYTVYLLYSSFNDKFAIANNVNSSTGQLDVTMPQVPPASNYTLQFVSVETNPVVYGQSPAFSIAPTPSTTSSSRSATASGVSVTGTMTMSSTMTMPVSESMTSSGSMAMSVMSAADSASAHASGAASSAKASASASSAVRAVHDFTLGAVAGAVVIAFFSALRML
ncbi:hypothetical protein FB45DRAFT_58645 [Roridomyces roridus]|uniref:Uncharacterized protein n=1 Tax=Roridomyces roridus TaxID=1738132 RepID=A0AAD7BPT9_9AGAR|nr:hypothetical protein FB45DRAFT_58645 [Roridomyces roridus]